MIKSRSLTDLAPDMETMCRQFLDICWMVGCRVFITETYRDNEYQDWLFSEGRTILRGGQSYHNVTQNGKPYALAFDVAFRPANNPRGATWRGPWDLIGEIGSLIGLEWGGYWMKRDRPHFQYPVQPQF